MARFFTALAGMDIGTAFGGMGSSREMTIASLAEPAMLMAIFTVSLISQSTSLSQIVTVLGHASFFPWGIAATDNLAAVPAAFLFLIIKLGIIGLVIVMIETGLAKMRIFRVTEFLGSAFLFSIFSVTVSNLFSSLPKIITFCQ